MKAAIYSRFSTDRQNDSSIADQIRICSEYAARERMQIVLQFEDQGISGAALGNRPGVLKMQEAALARRFDVLLVTDLSRVSRSNGDLSKLIDRVTAKGLRVVGVQDGYDSARRGHKLQAGLSGIMGEAFREMVKDRTYAALETRAKEQRPTGGKAYGYRTVDGQRVVDEAQAGIVREIFERYADGASCRTVAAELNAKGTPSPGSSWDRKVRRVSGWMGSGVRALVKNPLYAGRVHWNTSEWLKDPDSGKRTRRARPQSEWVTHTDETLRIVTDALWQRAQRRTRLQDNVKVKSGGKAKYALSGLLVCETCGSHFVMVDSRNYGCSSHRNGAACSNTVRIPRLTVESKILGKMKSDLLAPDVVAIMAKKLQQGYAQRMAAQALRSEQAPAEVQEIDARLSRLRERLQHGDPDMTPADIQAAIERAEAKRGELVKAQPMAKESAKILAILPRAAAEFRRQVDEGLSGNERAALRAKPFLREAFGGKIEMSPGADGSLFALIQLHPAVLLRGAGSDGSGGRI